MFELTQMLLGRGGGVRLKNKSFDIIAIVAYYPPPQRMQVDLWKATVAKLTARIHRIVQEAPRRALVVIGADTNSEFGRASTSAGALQYTNDGIHTGPFHMAVENYTSSELWLVMRMEGLAAVDTFYPRKVLCPEWRGGDYHFLLYTTRRHERSTKDTTRSAPRPRSDVVAT